MSIFNDPKELKKLSLKIGISRVLHGRRTAYVQSVLYATNSQDQKLFEECIRELEKEGCLKRFKGPQGGEMLEYVPAKATHEQGRADILAAGKPQA
jgi:hypothetical protein